MNILAEWSGSWSDLSFQWTGDGSAASFLVMGVVLVLFLMLIITMMQLVQPYMRANLAGVHVSMIDMIGMRLRRVKPSRVINAKIAAQRAGIDVSLNDLEAHLLAGGDPGRVVGQLMRAKSANVPMTWQHAAGCDLAGLDPMRAANR